MAAETGRALALTCHLPLQGPGGRGSHNPGEEKPQLLLLSSQSPQASSVLLSHFLPSHLTISGPLAFLFAGLCLWVFCMICPFYCHTLPFFLVHLTSTVSALPRPTPSLQVASLALQQVKALGLSADQVAQ